MSKHLSHNFQDDLVFFFLLLLLRPLSLDVTVFPDVLDRDNILFVWSDHSFILDPFFVYMQISKNLKKILHLSWHITDQSEMPPK